ncbi:hypothetical protein ACNOYE_22570 [Nannocystaceae bacterium ST9]
MADRRPQSGLYQLLLFPQRAEFLDQTRFDRYEVHLEHWRDLSREFKAAFEAVHTRGDACILLVQGQQGTGKTLFARRVEDDFKKVGGGKVDDERQNLWITLAGGESKDREIGERAAQTTAMRRVVAQEGWLADQRKFARENQQAIRVFLIDDVHKDVFLREWADLSQGDYLRLKADGKDDIALASVAQRLVEDCRGDFQRSLFVLLSNDGALLARLHLELERWHAGLSRPLQLPVPEPDLKEQIVRTNTNRLNRQSYWYCLDRGGPDEKRRAYETLKGGDGFLDAFRAIDRALGAGATSNRPGRPANKNLLTLVTLGSDPLTVRSFIDDRDLRPDEDIARRHVGTWLFRQQWASALSTNDAEFARRAELLESEFTLHWVTLDMKAVWWLSTAPEGDPTCAHLVEMIRMSPSIGDDHAVKKDTQRSMDLVDAEVEALADEEERASFESRFRAAGQGRSREYEKVLARRFGMELSHGLLVLKSVKPDLILGEYEPCAVTRATSAKVKAIEVAIRRACHVIEFTAHLQPDLRGLDEYLREKVDVYATLLESV